MNTLVTILIAALSIGWGNTTAAQDSTTDFIHFPFDQSELDKKALLKIDSIYAITLHFKRSFNIALEGHTDNYGSDAYNEMLSQKGCVPLKISLLKRVFHPKIY